MELYIGGFAQGKLEYVKRRYNENQKTEKLFVKVIECADSNYKKMLLETGCDLVMIGRGLLGNPWLIKECNDYLNEGKLPKKVTYKEKIEMMKRHLTDLVSEKGEKNAVLEIRTHFLYYLKGLEGSSEIKNMICKETSYENIIKILDNYLNQLDNLL